MKRTQIILILILFTGLVSRAQIVTTDPDFATCFDSIIVFFDASLSTGDGGNDATSLEGYTGSDVYAHTGVTIEGEGTWKYVISEWDDDSAKCKLERVSGDLWKLVIGDPYKYYHVPSEKKITQLCFVFRNSGGSRSGRAPGGADIFLDLFEPGVTVTFSQPLVNNEFSDPRRQPVFLETGDTLDILSIGVAIGTEVEKMELLVDDLLTETVFDDTLDYSYIADAGYGRKIITVIAYDVAELSDTGELVVMVNPPVQDLSRSLGITDGINYIDDNTVVVSLNAPEKDFAYVIGDFNDWMVDEDYFMQRDSIDAMHVHWWLEINGLSDTEEYGFQYLVDGEIRVADPYSEKILDPWNDQYITSQVYPALKIYPAGKTEQAVTAFKTAEPEYQWKTTGYVRPPKEELVIYELLVRDFLEAHNYSTLVDTLDYLEDLGVNAIELMPVNEFEGNISWGYNPSFHMALDKYYGPKNTFKSFIDSCHSRDIAVILDVVFNHAFGQSPLVRLYSSGDFGPPTAQNPWFNVTATHPFNVGYDFNHESILTQEFLDRVNAFWITEYNVDGYRFDLSKGFMQTGDFYGYNASRIVLLKRMADEIRTVDPDTYVILEHLGENTEEKELAEYGMMLWGNLNHDYAEAAMGYTSDFTWAASKGRGWTVPHLVTYMESHDEERLMYKTLMYGNSSGEYNTKAFDVAIKRMELDAVFFLTIPGPKMIWQFGELGYDHSINRCPDGSINDVCRLDPKPIEWDYYEMNPRKRLYQLYQSLIQLRKDHEVFNTSDYSYSLAASAKRLNLNHADLKVTILGNFGVTQGSLNPSFQESGYWFDYFTGDSINVINVTESITLQPGEYRVYTNRKLTTPDFILDVNETLPNVTETRLTAYPNPSRDNFTIQVAVPQFNYVTLTIFDITGKEVNRLIDGREVNDIHEYMWDGKNSTGNEVESGIYFIRLSTQHETHIIKVIKY